MGWAAIGCASAVWAQSPSMPEEADLLPPPNVAVQNNGIPVSIPPEGRSLPLAEGLEPSLDALKPVQPPPAIPPAKAVLGDVVYTTASMRVEQVADTSETARLAAFEEAERMGLKAILERQTPERAATLFSLLDKEQIHNIVQHYRVKDEIKTATTYRATLTLTYDPEAIRALVGERIKALETEPSEGLIAPTSANTTLVVPVWKLGADTVLWEADNPWRKVLQSVALEEGKGKIILPTGDPKDLRLMSIGKVLDGRYADLKPAAERYGTQEVLVLVASQEKPMASATLHITLRRLAQGNTDISYVDIPANPKETNDHRLHRAAQEMVEATLSSFRAILAPAAEAKQQRIRAVSSLDRAIDWANLRTKLSSLSMIEAIEPIHISTNEVEMDLVFNGTPTALGKGLKEANIHVTPLKDKLKLSFYPTP